MQDYVRLHAAVVAGNKLYLGDHERMLGSSSVYDLSIKQDKIRWAWAARWQAPVTTRAG